MFLHQPRPCARLRSPTQLKDNDLSGPIGKLMEDSEVLQGFFGSASLLGAFLGSVMVFPLADKIGRKKELQIGSIM